MNRKSFLKVGLFNAGSLCNNHDEFIAAMKYHDTHIMAINETWLRHGEEDRAPRVPYYRLRHIPRPVDVKGGRGGGVGFYVRCGINARTRALPIDPVYKIVEQMWISLSVNGKKIAIGTAYRPPWLLLSTFLDALTDSVNFFSNYDNIILLGDFNVNILDQLDKKARDLNTAMYCLSLRQIVNSPTHFTDSSQTLIDLVWTDLHVKQVKVEPFGLLRGHSFVICEFAIKHDKITPHTVVYRPLKTTCLDQLNYYLQSVSWDSMFLNDDVNHMVEVLTSYILMLFNLYVPIKTVVFKDKRYPWITDNIIRMIRLRNEALAMYRRTKLQTKKDYYKDLKSLVNKSMFFEKSSYFRHNINNNSKDSKKLWNNLKRILLDKNSRAELPSLFNDADVINRHFLDIPGGAEISMSQLTYFEFHVFNANAIFSLQCVSANVIFKIIRDLKSNAVGSDGISLDMLLLTLPNSLEALTRIVNTSIRTATFPNSWKTGLVRPLPKHNNPSEVNDLRPISILPCASKILERVICQQLTAFIERNNILPEFQSGFRKGHSTSTALMDVTDNILAFQDEGKCTLLVLLDFSRAFDTINITLLLSKMSYYGFDSVALKWFNSYLMNRTQYVELRKTSGSTHCTSDTAPMTRGIPQGSILGPILFIIYCADIINCLKKCHYHIYADDLQIYIPFSAKDIGTAIGQLNDDLDRIVHWAAGNSLKLNPSKSKFMIFGSRHQLSLITQPVNIMISGDLIERVYEAKNLGLCMDTELRFEKHVITSVQNCFFRLKTIYKLRPYLSEELRIQLVESLVLSKLNYADTVYGPRLLARSQRLIQRVQNACARFCYSIPRRAHVTPFLNQQCTLKMKSRRKLHLACLLFGVVKFNIPNYLSSKLHWTGCHRECARRQCTQPLSIKYHRTTTCRGGFRYAASKIWNNLPPPIRNLTNLDTFRKKVKIFLTDKQIQHAGINKDFSFI